LQTALDGKAASSHTHTIANVTGLQTALDGKQASGSYAPATGISQSAVANLTTDLAGKAATSHTHDASEIITGTISNARTTAAFTNTAGAIVLRDGGGGFRAGQIISSSLETGNFKATDNITIYPDGTGSKFFQATPGNITVFKDATVSDSAILSLGCTFESDSGTNFINFNRNYSFIGSITQSGTSSIAYNTTSDYRLKTNLEPLTDAVARLLQIPAHRFNWLADPTAPKVDGFLAHEAQAVVPECVTGTKDAVDAEGKPIHQGIDQSKLVPLLVAAVQELAARVAALEAR
jgi:hypothetical protein